MTLETLLVGAVVAAAAAYLAWTFAGALRHRPRPASCAACALKKPS